MRLASGREPTNLDLFVDLDEEINDVEAELSCQVAFWFIGREHNGFADALAREAALGGTPTPV